MMRRITNEYTRGCIVGVLLIVGCDMSTVNETARATTSAEQDWRSQHVVFYNVENLFDIENDPRTNDDWFTPGSDIQWDNAKYQRKLEQLARAISMTANELPILVGLAEVESESCVHDLASTDPLKDGRYRVVHFDSPDERGIDVALLYRAELFTVVDQSPIEVKLPNDRTRDILHVTGTISKEPVHVFVCHWSSRGEGVQETEHRRIAAAKMLRNEVDRILGIDPNASILIMGDMNDYPTSPSITDHLKAACNDQANGDLINLVCSEHKAGRGSYNYKGDWGYIDQFIVSSAMLDDNGTRAGEAKALWRSELLFDHPKYGPSPDKTFSGRKYHGGFSDHLPIVLQLTR